jgi:FkbM family methyltransferase
MKNPRWFASVPYPNSFLGRVIRSPLRFMPDNKVVRVLSGINKGDLWITGSGTTHGCWIGNYEADHTSALQRLVKPGAVAYDIGSHAGFYTLALSRLVGDAGRVFAFEPSARSVYYLRRHLELNGRRNVTVVQSAIGSDTGLISFDGFAQTSEKKYLVPSMSLDEFIAGGFPFPSFIKMDIEGAEKYALEGAAQALSKIKATWMIATHSADLRIQCRALMAKYGYHFEQFDSTEDPGSAPDFWLFRTTGRFETHSTTDSSPRL